jgi:hypothetical protein
MAVATSGDRPLRDLQRRLHGGDGVAAGRARAPLGLLAAVRRPVSLLVGRPRSLELSRLPQFFEHYTFVVRELARLTMPGRMTAVHCMDVPSGNSGTITWSISPATSSGCTSVSGSEVHRAVCIWKEPLGVRNRTMAKNLAHKTIVEDSSRAASRRPTTCSCSARRQEPGADRASSRAARVRRRAAHAGRAAPLSRLDRQADRESVLPLDLAAVRVRVLGRHSLGRVLPFRRRAIRDDEKHVHPLQLDVIDRVLTLWSNPGETVLTPFMGVGSEVFAARAHGTPRHRHRAESVVLPPGHQERRGRAAAVRR